MLKNRLSDRIADIFQQAVMTGDLDTAEDLLTIMQNMHERRQAAAGERRVDDEAIVRARHDLDTRKALRGATPRKPPPAV